MSMPAAAPAGMRGRLFLECYRADGRLRWRAEGRNLVVDQGLTNMLEVYYRGPQTGRFLGLTGADPVPGAGDTMGTHPGWTEVTDYDEPARPAYNADPAANKSISNPTNKAQYTVNATVTIGGCFCTSDATKGGVTGILVSVMALNEGNRQAFASDVLQLTYTSTMAAL